LCSSAQRPNRWKSKKYSLIATGSLHCDVHYAVPDGISII
jgi:hypothetical protein